METPTFEPLTGQIGAVVHGADLSRPPCRALGEVIFSGLIESLVLVFPRQAISPERHVELGRALGELEPRHPLYPVVDQFEHVMVIENGPERPPDNEMWHADMTFRPQPPRCSLLHAKVLPSKGGDTLFANMYAVYEDLSERLKAYLATATAIHDVRAGFAKIFEENGETDRMDAMNRMNRSESRCIHPVVATHPITGRRYLNVNETFTSRIVEVSEEESRVILEMLFTRVRHPRYQVRHRWSVGDIVIWDNLATQHFAVGDYTEYRRMHRVTVRAFDSQRTASAA